MDTVSVNVRCSNEMHRISVLPGGSLVFHNHTKADRTAEDILVALGGQACRCMQVLQAWRNADRSVLPKELKPRLDLTTALRAKRKRRRTGKLDHLKIPIMTRVNARVHQLATTSLKQCTYRRSRSRWAGGNHSTSVSFAKAPSITGHAVKVWSANSKYGGNNSCISVYIEILNWYSRVYKRGLAVVDGTFVLDTISTDDNGDIHVLAGRQRAGFSVEMCRATISIDDDGRKTLRWSRNS